MTAGPAGGRSVSVADVRKGEVPFAFVAASQQSGVDETFLMKHCAENLTKYKVPRTIIVLDEIPKTPARKPDKKRLKEMAQELLR